MIDPLGPLRWDLRSNGRLRIRHHIDDLAAQTPLVKRERRLALAVESRGGVNPISTVGHAVHTVAIFVERDGVNVNLEARGVHQHEVAGRATVPESEPLVPKDLAQLSQIPDPHDDIDVLVWPSLHTEERINAPAAVEPYLEIRVDEESEQLNQGRGSHHSVLAPPNGSRLSCGRPARWRKVMGRQSMPANGTTLRFA